MRTQINNTLLLATLTICGLCVPAFGQSDGKSSGIPLEKSVRFGFKVTPNINWVRILEGRMENNGNSLGISYGIMADFNIGDNSSYWLGTELIITNMPGKIAAIDTLYNTASLSSGVPYSNAEFDYKLQYIQLPVTLKLKTGEIGNLRWWGQFGLSPGILIQNKVTTNTTEPFYKPGTNSHSPNSENNDPLDFEGITDGNEVKGRFIDDVRFYRLGLVLGAGVEFSISGNTSAILGLRFDNGFTDLFGDKAVKGRNNYLGIQAGVFF